MSENHRAQETYVGSDSNKSSLSAKYQSKLSARESLRSLYAQKKKKKNHEPPMYAKASSLSRVNLGPSPPPPELSGRKRDVSGL